VALCLIATPESEAELSLLLCELESRDIPVFVQNAGFGGLFPGPSIASYNARRVMVPEDFVEAAQDALQDLAQSTHALDDDANDVETASSASLPSRSASALRMVVEFLWFGWFMPRRR
jgi:hypothetical protein